MRVLKSFASRAPAEAARDRLEGVGIQSEVLEWQPPFLDEDHDPTEPILVFHVAVPEELSQRAETILSAH
jgi:hypothetical protein